jgi:hypothetical protein
MSENASPRKLQIFLMVDLGPFSPIVLSFPVGYNIAQTTLGISRTKEGGKVNESYLCCDGHCKNHFPGGSGLLSL